MTIRTKGKTFDAATVKAAAAGRWLEILPAAGVPAVLLDGKGHPCPKCGGDDRFAAFKDVAERGAVHCRNCLGKGGGDGLATVAWVRGIDFPAAVRFVAEFLGLQPEGNGKPRIVATYDFPDENGRLLYQVARREPGQAGRPKDFLQRRPKPGGGWIWNMQGIVPVPYRLPELLLADASRPVVIVEGEKDADALAALGIVATTNHGGADNWTATHAKHLAGRRVVIVPDADESGERHAQTIAASLQGIAASVRLVRLPTGKDASEWLAAGGTPEALAQLIDAAPEWAPSAGPVIGSAAPAQWPELERLDDDELPRFPAAVLPEILAAWVTAEAYATQTPADLSGLLALATVAAGIASHIEVQPNPANPRWLEPVNLFAAVLLGPGNRKTAVFGDATRPLQDAEKALQDEARPAVARELSERRRAQKRLERCEKLAAEKNDKTAAAEAGELAEKLALWPEPTLPVLIVDDCTPERLAELLAINGGRLASLSPEGGVFDLMAGKYSRNGSADFNIYLQAHAGDPLRSDRVSRRAVRCDRPALTCSYAVQPQVIAALMGNPVFRGRGLLARFLYARPSELLGGRIINPDPVPDSLAEAYADLVWRLATDPPNGTLTLSPDAAQEFHDWQASIEAMLAEGGELEAIRDWGGKLAGETARLAAILHCVQHCRHAVSSSIDAATVRAAIEIGRYLIPHAQAVLCDLAGDGPLDDARYILRWILRHARQDFTKRDVHQHGKRRFPTANDIDPALKELSRRGYVRATHQELTGPGRPPSPAYEVNPAVFDSGNTGNRPQNSQNATSEADNGNSGNTGSAFEQTETTRRVQVSI